MSGFLRSGPGHLGDDPDEESSLIPGKRTLTSRLPAGHAADRDGDVASPLLQRTESASAAVSGDDPFAMHLGDRQQSKFGDASPLPFRSEMEAGFGTSLDDVTAYKGPEARAAASASGTEAFAMDRQIIFGREDPSKHVVAHEVAHTLQQRNGGVGAGAIQAFTSTSGDPLEREAEHAAAIVDKGGRATIVGTAGAGEAQGFSLGDALKKVVNDYVKDETGYDAAANTFDTDLDTLTDAMGVVGWAVDVKALAAVGKIHLHIDFKTGTISISGAGLTMAGYTSDSFSCGATQLGPFVISAVWDGKKDNIKAAGFQTASLKVANIVYHDGKAVPPLDLKIDLLTTGALNAGGVNIGGKLDWLVGLNIPQATITGIHYPGLSAPLNATLTKTSFALREVGGVLSNSGSTGSTLTAAPDVLPAGTVIDIELDEGNAAVDQTGKTYGTSTKVVTDRKIGASFKHFEAVAKKDGGELGRVEIDDFQLGDNAKGTGAQIGRLLFKGDPKLVEGILASPPVAGRVAEALAVLRGAGIDPKVSFNVELKGIAVGKTKEAFLDKDKEILGGSIKNLDAKIHVANVGTAGGEGDLHVKMVGFAGAAQGSAINAQFESFSASLAVKGAGTVSLTLNGKNHTKIDLNVLGDVSQVQASCDFTMVGDISQLVDTLGKEAPKLPPEVTTFLPVLKKLGLKNVTATGSVAANASKDDGSWVVGVGSDLGLEVPVGDKIKLNLGFKMLYLDKEGKYLGGGFNSMLAKLFVSDKEVASLQVDGCQGWKEDDLGKSMHLAKVQANASGNGLAQLASALNNGKGLPREAKAIVQAVANHTIANSKAIATINDLDIKQDADGKETADAKSFAASVWVQNVGGVVVTLYGFHQQDEGKGKQQIAFDRLTADLNTTTKQKAAQIEVKGEKTEITGAGFKFSAKKVHAEGDGALLGQLIKGVQSHINNLPKEIQDSLALVDEFMVNGKGSIDLNNVAVKDGAKGTKATTDFATDLAIQGVGKVHVEISKMDAEIDKESTTVKFESFAATLKGLKEEDLAAFKIVRPADGTPGAKVDATGEQANRDKLFDAIKAHVGALPAVVVTVIDLLKKGSEASVVGDNVEVKKAGDNVEARGNLSGDVNIEKIGHVTFKLVGKPKAGTGAETDDIGGFESLYVTVTPTSGAVAATLDAKGGAVKKDKSFHLDSFNLTGDATIIAELFTEEAQALVHPDVKMWLQRLEQSKLTMGKGTNLDVKTTENGVTSTLDALDVEGKVSFVTDSNKTIVVPKAHLNLKTVKLAHDKAKGSTVVGTTGAHVGGVFSYQDLGSGLEAQGDVDVTTGAINGTVDSNGTQVTVKDVKGTGKVTKTDLPKQASTTMPEQPKGDQKMLDEETKDAANEGVPLVKTIHLHTYTPVTAGNYDGLHILPGTNLEIDIMATGSKLGSAIAWFVPQPNIYGLVDFDGAGITPKGNVGELKVATGNLFTEWVANMFLPGKVKDYVGDSNKIPLELTELTQLVTTKLAGMTKTKSNEPSMADVANAIRWKETGGSAIIELEAKKDTVIKGATVTAGSAIYLRGEATNGKAVKLNASAEKLAVKMDGLSAEAAGVSASGTGAKSLDFFKLTKLNIQELNVNMPAAKPGSVQKHAAGAQHVADEHVPQIAAAGVAGSGSALPQLETIQRSFGRHDVSHVQAHVGGAAGEAAGAIGAEAYATGDRVAFASQPDLFTAAHEAAHVVQQQGGVQLSGGVGHAGDPYERHADAVAEAVVAGRSAEPLLDQMAGGGGSPAVQRIEPGTLPADAPVKSSSLALPGIGLGGGPMLMVTDDTRVRDWLKAHKHDVQLSTMPEIIRRVRVDLAPESKSIAVASHQQILDWLHNASTATGVHLPADALPMSFSPEEIKAAAQSGFSLSASITANVNNGRFNVVAFGKTPDVPKDGVQVAVDSSGASLSAESHGSKTTVQATTDMGVKFSTNIGPVAFSAGIDPNQWQVGLSFGPEITQLSSLAGIMSNAQDAVSAGARKIAAGSVAKADALYASIKPHLPAIKEAMSAAQSIAAAKPGQVSAGVTVTGPGYKPYAAEGAVQGITVMATLTITF